MPNVINSGTTSMIVLTSQRAPIVMPAARSHTGQTTVPLCQLPADCRRPVFSHTRT